jgi:uncharacterized protein YbjT (DUF2867 family)
MLLVVGATGQLGGAITRRLLAAGREVRILVRPGSNYAGLEAAGAQPVLGDLRDRASLVAACQGVRAIVSTAIPHPMADADAVRAVILDGHRDLIDAGRAAGADRFVFTAGYGADPHSPVPFIAAKGQVEEYLRGGRQPYTILEPDMLMDNVLMVLAGRPVLQGQPVWVAGEARDRHAFVAVDDVAALAVAALDHPAAVNRTIPFGGPEALTLPEVAAICGRVLDCPVTVRSFPPDQPPADLPPIITGLLLTVSAYTPVPGAVETAREFGVRQTSVEEFMRGKLVRA